MSKGVISYGVTSYGYDARLGNKFKVFTNVHGEIVDPKNFSPKSFVSMEGDTCVIPPNSFVLGETFEVFKIPRDILAICVGKSTYARCGLIVNVTPLEPEWEGKITIEISNTTPLPAKIYAHEGIAQIIFLRADCARLLTQSDHAHGMTCTTSYADRRGKYQNQAGIVLPFVR